jgi:hypothetical protein
VAYIEIWKGEKLITKREVDEQRAEKGCRVRLGSKGQIRIRLGESKTVGSYRVNFLTDQTDVPPTETGKEPAGSVTTNGLSKLQFSGPSHKVNTPALRAFPKIEGYHILNQIGRGGMGAVLSNSVRNVK